MTFSVTALLDEEALQTFELYFVDDEQLWHRLFSVTFKVETTSTVELQAKLKQNKTLKRS